MTLYDAFGNVRTFADGPSRLRGAQLAQGERAVIVATDRDGRAITVRLREDGSYTAASAADRGGVQFDSRDVLSHDAAVVALGQRAAALVGLAGAGGTDIDLAVAAKGALTAAHAAIAPGSSLDGFTLSVTDTKGTSQYVGGAGGVVSASRSTVDVALEVVTQDGGVTSDSVRHADGSGTTTISGGALGGTTFALTRDANGKESIDVASAAPAFASASALAVASLALTDAFGDVVTIGGANGKPEIGVRDALGDAFAFSAGGGGTDASLGVALGIGEGTGTKRAILQEEASATTQTGSTIRASGGLEATGKDGERGSVSLHAAATIVAASGSNQGIVTTDAAATLQLGAEAGGTMDVAGAGAALAENGFRDAKGNQQIAGGTERHAGGAVQLFRADARRVIDVTVDANDEEKHAEADTKHENGATHDVAMLAVSAFGRHAGAVRTDDILRHHDKPSFSSSETLF